MNGTFDKCCIIRPSGVVKTYFTVEDSKSISFEIDEYDYKYLFDLIEQYSDEYNIIIDSRMSFLILISYFRFGDALIVYDVMRLKMSRILHRDGLRRDAVLGLAVRRPQPSAPVDRPDPHPLRRTRLPDAV